MELVQQNLEEITHLHLRHRNERLPSLKNRMECLNTELVSIQKEKKTLAHHLWIPKRQKCQRLIDDLKKEIDKYENQTLFDNFSKQVNTQVGRMIVDEADVNEAILSKQEDINHVAKKRRLLSVLKMSEVAIPSIDCTFDEMEIILPTDQSGNSSSDVTNQELSIQHQRRKEFLLGFQQLNVAIPNNLEPVRAKDLVLNQKIRQLKQQQEDEISRRVKHFCIRKGCNSPLLFLPNESRFVCPVCSHTVEQNNTILFTHSFEQEIDVTTTANTRGIRLAESLEAFQSKKTVDIPLTLLLRIKSHLRNDRHKLITKLTVSQVETMLKLLGYRDFYRFKFQLMFLLNNEYWPVLSNRQEKDIYFIFNELEKSFEFLQRNKIVQGQTKDLLSFPQIDSVLYHICHCLSQSEPSYLTFLPYLKQLNSGGKQSEQMSLLNSLFETAGISYSVFECLLGDEDEDETETESRDEEI